MIRALQTEDIESLVGAQGIFSSPSLYRQAILDRSESRNAGHYLPMSETYVWEEDGRPVGFIFLLDDYLAALFVGSAVQGKGCGKKLLGHAKSLKKSLRLEVYAHNDRAVRFYLSQGFVTVEQMIDESVPAPEYVMIWTERDNRNF